jgi:hypothetical protein
VDYDESAEVEEHDPTQQRLWNRRTPLRHPYRESSKRMRSWIRSM